MGSTICTAGFPSAAMASSCFTARCASIWYGFFIATLLFSAKENCSYPIKAASGESLLSTIYRAFPTEALYASTLLLSDVASCGENQTAKDWALAASISQADHDSRVVGVWVRDPAQGSALRIGDQHFGEPT